jgi:hypothetical protein
MDPDVRKKLQELADAIGCSPGDVVAIAIANLHADRRRAGLLGRTAEDDAARAVVTAAGAAGGIDEVRRLADKGWPCNRPLDGDSPALREAIRLAAIDAVRSAYES